jgi:hypothetical protein
LKFLRLSAALFLAVACAASPARSEEAKESAPPSKGALWLSAGAGAVLGFGVGHAALDRWKGYGWAFTAVDTVGWSLVLANMGDCRDCRGGHREAARAGLGILLVSRVVQVADLVLYGSRNGMFADREKPGTISWGGALLPGMHGPQAIAAASMCF